MRNLLIEEMKRAIVIMEAKPELNRYNPAEECGYKYMELDKDMVELRDLFRMIRRHSVLVEKDMNGKLPSRFR